MTYFIFARNYAERFAIRRALPSTAMEVVYVESPRHLEGIMLKEGDVLVEPQGFADGPTGQPWMEVALKVMQRAGLRGMLMAGLSQRGLIFHRMVPDGSLGSTGEPEPDLKNQPGPTVDEIEVGLMSVNATAMGMKYQTVGLLGGWKSPWDNLHEDINGLLDDWEVGKLRAELDALPEREDA